MFFRIVVVLEIFVNEQEIMTRIRVVLSQVVRIKRRYITTQIDDDDSIEKSLGD